MSLAAVGLDESLRSRQTKSTLKPALDVLVDLRPWQLVRVAQVYEQALELAARSSPTCSAATSSGAASREETPT